MKIFKICCLVACIWTLGACSPSQPVRGRGENPAHNLPPEKRPEPPQATPSLSLDKIHKIKSALRAQQEDQALDMLKEAGKGELESASYVADLVSEAVDNDSRKILKYLAENQADLNKPNTMGRTSVGQALVKMKDDRLLDDQKRYGETRETLSLLLDLGARSAHADKSSLSSEPLLQLYEDFKEPELARKALKTADLNGAHSDSNMTIFHMLARDGNKELLQEALNSLPAGESEILNKKDGQSHTAQKEALCYAHENNHKEVAEILRAKRARCTFKVAVDPISEASLKKAIYDGKEAVAISLLEKGLAEGSIALNKEWLHEAAKYGRLAVLRRLIELGAFVDQKNNLGETPLLIAADKANYEILKLLVNSNADLNARVNSYTALGLILKAMKISKILDPTAYAQQRGIVKLLLEKGVDPNVSMPSYLGSPFLNLYNELEEPELAKLALRAEDVSAEQSMGQSIFHIIAERGDNDIFEQAFSLLPSDNQETQKILNLKGYRIRGGEALCIAQKKGLSSMAQKLQSKGALCSEEARGPQTEATNAPEDFYWEIIFRRDLEAAALLDKYAPTGAINVNDGSRKFLYEAANRNLIETVKKLIAYGALVNAKVSLYGEEKETLCFIDKKLPVYTLLTSKGALCSSVKRPEPRPEPEPRPASQPLDDKAALKKAIEDRNEDAALALLKKGTINVNDPSLYLLHLAAKYDLLELAKGLIARGAAFNGKTSVRQSTPMQLAAANGSMKVLGYLVDLPGIDKEAKDKDANTALGLAMTNKKLQALELLLDKGALSRESRTTNNSEVALELYKRGEKNLALKALKTADLLGVIIMEFSNIFHLVAKNTDNDFFNEAMKFLPVDASKKKEILDHKDSIGKEAICYAQEKNNNDMVTKLLAQNASACSFIEIPTCDEIRRQFPQKKKMSLAYHPDRVCSGKPAAEKISCAEKAAQVFSKLSECYKD